MNPNTRAFTDRGQRLWLDQITRRLLRSGTLARYIAELSVTGLTSNPTIFARAIRDDDSYDDAIRELTAQGLAGEAIFFNLALDDLGQAADLFRPVFDGSGGVDGWASLEVSPLFAGDCANTIKAARHLHARAARPNLLIKIPGTPEGIPAIEQSIADGIPINITLLFSRAHYLAAAAATMRGIERRLAAGKDPAVASVASIFVSRWDAAVTDRVPAALRNRLGIAVAMRIYKAHLDLLASTRWQRLAAAGALPPRLLWASTGSKDPAVADLLYVEALVAPDTIDTLPEATLLACADHGRADHGLPADAGYAEAVLAEFLSLGIDDEVLAAELQGQGVAAFARSWGELLDHIGAKGAGAHVGAADGGGV